MSRSLPELKRERVTRPDLASFRPSHESKAKAS